MKDIVISRGKAGSTGFNPEAVAGHESKDAFIKSQLEKGTLDYFPEKEREGILTDVWEKAQKAVAPKAETADIKKAADKQQAPTKGEGNKQTGQRGI